MTTTSKGVAEIDKVISLLNDNVQIQLEDVRFVLFRSSKKSLDDSIFLISPDQCARVNIVTGSISLLAFPHNYYNELVSATFPERSDNEDF